MLQWSVLKPLKLWGENRANCFVHDLQAVQQQVGGPTWGFPRLAAAMQELVRRFHPAAGDTETQQRLRRAAAACVRDAKRFMGAEVSEAVTISRLGSRPGD